MAPGLLFIGGIPMKINMNAVKAMMWALAVGAVTTGCDRTISKSESEKVKSDGTVEKSEKSVTQSPDGTIKKEEKSSTEKP
jgi:hypothetical protein